MLARQHRLRSSADFTRVMRRGRRAASDVVVVHVVPGGSPATRIGLIVSKSVGNSVVRHRVSRRLRAVLASRIDSVDAGSDVVVRALPASASASSARLSTATDRAFRTLNGARRDRPARAVPPVSRS